jgi:hypothetical protein
MDEADAVLAEVVEAAAVGDDGVRSLVEVKAKVNFPTLP